MNTKPQTTFNAPKIVPTPEKQLINNIKAMIMKKVEAHKIRLTPSEFSELINSYLDRFINDVDLQAIMQISDDIIRRNK